MRLALIDQQEVTHIKAIFDGLSNSASWKGKITVVIAAKRHHIRTFPGKLLPFQ